MATVKEVQKEIDKIRDKLSKDRWDIEGMLGYTINIGIEIGKKEGIQLEKERLRKQVKKTSEDQQCPDILIDDIDIWNDKKIKKIDL